MSFTRITGLLLGFGLATLACSSDPNASGDGTGDTTTGTGGDIQGGTAGDTQSGTGGSTGVGGDFSGTGGATGTGGGAAGGKSGNGGSTGVGGSTGAGGGGMGGSTGSSGGMMGAAAPRFIGRWDANQSAWSGSAIEFRFNGPSLSVTMSGGNFWYAVTVDGGTPKKTQIGATAMLATGLAAGPHVVQMVRRAEAFNGISKFVSQTPADLLPQVIPGRRLEVIGDSFAVAYGIDGCGDRTNGDEDANKSWAWDLARTVKADVDIIAQSGIGMAFSLDGSTTFTIPAVYTNALGTQNQTKWDTSKYIPDAILIDVGENDQNSKSNGTPVYNATTYKQKYSDFLTTLRGYYPNAFIYCGSHGDLTTDIQAMVTAKADPKIKFIKFDGTRTACDFHPDVAGHAAYAATAAAALKADLGWN
jgi:hypothetical protein